MTLRAARLPLALLMDLLGSYAAAAVFVQIFGGGDGPAPSFVAVAAVAAGSFALARALQQTDLDERTFRIAGAAISAVALFAILHTEYAATIAPWHIGWLGTLLTDPETYTGHDAHVFAGVVALCALWLRGIARGQRTLDFDDVFGTAGIGLLAVAIAAISSPAARGPQSSGALAIAYVVVALSVLALYQAPDPDRSVRGFASQWAIGTAGVITIAIALAVTAAAIDPGAFGFLAPIGRPLQLVAEVAVTYVLGPIIGGIAWLIDALLPSFHPKPHEQPQQPLPLGERRDQHDAPSWLRIVGFIIAGGALTALGVALIVIIGLAFRRYARPKPRAAERRESIEAESMLGDDLAALIGNLARRFRRTPHAAQSSVEVHRLYHEMLACATASGLERPPAATPLQFAPTLEAHYASGIPASITEAFTASRYGRHAISDETVQMLRTDWHRLEQRAT
jgi:hypothetical protein